jgi:hypothetical protein
MKHETVRPIDVDGEHGKKTTERSIDIVIRAQTERDVRCPRIRGWRVMNSVVGCEKLIRASLEGLEA